MSFPNYYNSSQSRRILWACLNIMRNPPQPLYEVKVSILHPFRQETKIRQRKIRRIPSSTKCYVAFNCHFTARIWMEPLHCSIDTWCELFLFCKFSDIFPLLINLKYTFSNYLKPNPRIEMYSILQIIYYCVIYYTTIYFTLLI